VVIPPNLAHLTPTEALEIDAICDDFERHWQRARRRNEPPPRPATFLQRSSERFRPTLLKFLEDLVSDLAHEPVLPEVPGLVLEAEIGRGGMGVVYRAREPAGSEVAVKLVHGMEQLEFEEFAELDHPHLIRLHRWGRQRSLPYLVMQLARGGDLRERFADWYEQEKAPDWREAACTMEKVAHAVAYLHRQSILHRDLKPSNILLTERDTLEPLVCDFGLAARLSEAHDGRMSGTPSYMAPEQRAGMPLTVAADIWSLGAILAEWIADSPLTPVYCRCLQDDPAQRYESAADLAEALRRGRDDSSL